MTAIHPQPERDLIIALFHRIGEQLELKEEWQKLPNAERSAMAGDFYNIIASHSDFEFKPWVTAYQEGVLKGISVGREKVLGELITRIQSNMPLPDSTNWKNAYIEGCEMVIDIIDSFRQGKDGE